MFQGALACEQARDEVASLAPVVFWEREEVAYDQPGPCLGKP